MANITETSNFDTNVYLLEKSDAALGGVSGKANIQAIALANRTRYLKDQIDGIKARVKQVVNYPGATVANGVTINADGSVYSIAYPLASPDFTTPNDGVTRNWKITVTCIATSMTITSGNGQLAVYTTTSGPTYNLLVNAPFRVALTSVCSSIVVSLEPNVRIKTSYANNSTGANMVIGSAQMIIEEFV